MQIGRTALMMSAVDGKIDCLSALIQAKADVDQKTVVRLGVNVVLVLIWGLHDAMSTQLPNVSLFDLPIRVHSGW